MTIKFEIGDRVELKSGSPIMTVEEISPDGKISCIWFDKLTPRSRNFDRALLKFYVNPFEHLQPA